MRTFFCFVWNSIFDDAQSCVDLEFLWISSFVRTWRFVSSLSFLRKCSSVLRSSSVKVTHRFSVDVKFGCCVSASNCSDVTFSVVCRRLLYFSCINRGLYQHAKKVVSVSSGLLDFAVGLVDSVEIT